MFFLSSQAPAQDSVRIHKCGFKTYPPHLNALRQPVLRNQQAPFGRKFIRATGFVLISEACEMGILLLSAESFSKWKKSENGNIGDHYKAAFTKPPVIDRDTWWNDYLGHPYQGAFDYNLLRSQGAPWWQSALFVTLHSTLFEYAIEAAEERPSIQDLILTPVGGALMGELFHFATMRMCRNGITWYEGIVICLINPAFLLNNGFKFLAPKNFRQ
jgi:hypothetical protein